MNGVDLIRDRLAGVEAVHRDAVNDAAGLDWATPVLPRTSPIGLTLWHVPRTIDWLVNASIRALPEAADDPAFADLPSPDRFGFATGLTPSEAVEAAAQVAGAGLLGYAAAVSRSADEWLASLTDEDLDAKVPEFDERQRSRPSYCTPAALAEVSHLGNLTIGQLLARPTMAHLYLHLGEVKLLIAHATGK